jgi:hypothetical protein
MTVRINLENNKPGWLNAMQTAIQTAMQIALQTAVQTVQTMYCYTSLNVTKNEDIGSQNPPRCHIPFTGLRGGEDRVKTSQHSLLKISSKNFLWLLLLRPSWLTITL